MRTPVAVTLIIVGAALILTPIITGCVFATTIALNGPRHITVNVPGFAYGYQWASMAIGALMIGAATLATRREG